MENKLIPCKCGELPLMYYYHGMGWHYECPKCGAKAEPGKTMGEARENWERMVGNA